MYEKYGWISMLYWFLIFLCDMFTEINAAAAAAAAETLRHDELRFVEEIVLATVWRSSQIKVKTDHVIMKGPYLKNLCTGIILFAHCGAQLA